MTTSTVNYINTLLEEKGIDQETVLTVEGPSGTNWIPVEALVEAIGSASAKEQQGIKNTLVQIDFKNGDVMHFFKHIAQAIAQ